MSIVNKVKSTIEKHHLIEQGDVLVLGLSGGPDSLALLHVLMELSGELGFDLKALHLNHNIRGEESDGDEAFIRQHCKESGVELWVVSLDIPQLAAESGESLEECARNYRRQALFDFAMDISDKEGRPVKIVLAHNKNDQAETVLMRMIRGTGTRGLGAMDYASRDGIIRPLLDCERSEIEEYCEEKGLTPRIDSTNSNTDYTRNKVRLEVLPKLAEMNPNIADTLARLADSAREDDAFLQFVSENIARGLELESTDKVIRLDAKKLLANAPAVFARVVKYEFGRIGLTEDIASVHIEALRRVLESGTGNKTVEFPRGRKAYINRGIVELS